MDANEFFRLRDIIRNPNSSVDEWADAFGRLASDPELKDWDDEFHEKWEPDYEINRQVMDFALDDYNRIKNTKWIHIEEISLGQDKSEIDGELYSTFTIHVKSALFDLSHEDLESITRNCDNFSIELTNDGFFMVNWSYSDAFILKNPPKDEYEDEDDDLEADEEDWEE